MSRPVKIEVDLNNTQEVNITSLTLWDAFISPAMGGNVIFIVVKESCKYETKRECIMYKIKEEEFLYKDLVKVQFKTVSLLKDVKIHLEEE